MRRTPAAPQRPQRPLIAVLRALEQAGATRGDGAKEAAVLNVYFENVITRERRKIEPANMLRAVGGSLYRDDAPLAKYQGGLWRCDHRHYFIVGIECPTVIHFENASIRSETHGPYDPAWLVDGAVRAGESQETALARLDENSGAWHFYPDRTFWSAVVFQSPADA